MATKRFLPAFLDPAVAESTRRSSPPPTKTSLRLHRSASESAQGVWVAAGCANIRRGRFGSARSLHGGAASVRAWLGRKERGGGREKGSQLLAPEWLFLARLSDCYGVHTAGCPPPPGSVKPSGLGGGRSLPMPSSWCWCLWAGAGQGQL